MRKLIVIFLIFMLSPFSVKAAENQSIIFTGSYSLDNIGADADSAWLYIRYNGTLVDSTTITPEDLQWDGYYQYIHACTNDSVWGWSGWWIYFDQSETVQIGEWAIVATSRDSSYALHAQVDSLKDTTEDMSTRLLATGFSTFDPATDSVLVTMAVLFARLAADSVAMNLLPGVIDSTVYDTASMRYFFELFFTSALTLAQQLDTAHIAIKAVRDTAQYLVTGSGDTTGVALSVYAEFIDGSNEDEFKADVSALALEATVQALNDFDSESDLVKVKEIKANVLGDTTLQDNATEYKADTTGTAESVADQVWREVLSGHNLYGAAAVHILAIANVQALALAPGDHEQTTTRIALNLTATTNDVYNGCMLACLSGVNAGRTIIITDYEAYQGDSGVVTVSPALVLAATENQLFVITSADHAEGDTNVVQGATDTDLDSVLQAIADANKENFKADVSGLSTLTDNELRTALGDSLYNARMDSLLTVLVEVKGYSLDLAYYWGACDGCYYRLYPEGGLADKDSAIIIDPSQGADSLVGKVVYLHGTDVEIVDTVYFYRDEPW